MPSNRKGKGRLQIPEPTRLQTSTSNPSTVSDGEEVSWASLTSQQRSAQRRRRSIASQRGGFAEEEEVENEQHEMETDLVAPNEVAGVPGTNMAPIAAMFPPAGLNHPGVSAPLTPTPPATLAASSTFPLPPLYAPAPQLELARINPSAAGLGVYHERPMPSFHHSLQLTPDPFLSTAPPGARAAYPPGRNVPPPTQQQPQTQTQPQRSHLNPDHYSRPPPFPQNMQPPIRAPSRYRWTDEEILANQPVWVPSPRSLSEGRGSGGEMEAAELDHEQPEVKWDEWMTFPENEGK